MTDKGSLSMSPRCSDCPPEGYPTDETRCSPCDRRDKGSLELVEKVWNGPYEVVGSIYEGMMATVCEGGVGRSIAHCREYQDALLIADALNAAATPLVKMREALEALDRIATESIVETDKPDRIRWEGVWYDGPPATALLSLLRAVRELARDALKTGEE